MMGGGGYHLGKKGPLFGLFLASLWPLFVRLLSVFEWFFSVPRIPHSRQNKKKGKGARQKKMEGTNEPDPLLTGILYLLILVRQMARGFPRRRQGADLTIAFAKVLVG